MSRRTVIQTPIYRRRDGTLLTGELAKVIDEMERMPPSIQRSLADLLNWFARRAEPPKD